MFYFTKWYNKIEFLGFLSFLRPQASHWHASEPEADQPAHFCTKASFLYLENDNIRKTIRQHEIQYKM